jgi:PAS domain S-box-containing protein
MDQGIDVSSRVAVDPATASFARSLELRRSVARALAELRECQRRAADGALGDVLDDLEAALEQLETSQRAAATDRESLRHDAEAQLRAIFDNAAVGIRLVDVAAGGIIVRANRAFHELLGYEEGELVGRGVFELTHPDDVPRNRALYDEVVAGRLPRFQLEKRYLRRDGNTVWARLTVSPVRNPGGEVQFVIGLVEDITARREAEERLAEQGRELAESMVAARAILDAAVDGIVTIDERGLIESANPAAERLFGYTAAEMVGNNVSLLMPSPYREEHDRYLESYLATGHRKIIGIGREVVAQRKDGSTFPIDLGVAEVRQGGRRFFMGTIKDLTVRKQLEEQLLHAQKMEAIGRLAGAVAHDFNNLLASITGYSEMLVDRLADTTLRHGAQQIQRSAERGAALTRQLLAFSRRQELETELIDLNAVLLDLQDMMVRLLGERVELVYRLADILSPLRADRGQLHQVLLNLVVNARDALDEGGRIIISTDNVDLPQERLRHGSVIPAGSWVCLSVADDGCGMSEQIRQRIFEPFYTTKEPGKGTGLGLSTVYGIVQQSGGGVLVDSEPGVGTTFEVYLPRAEGHLDRPRPAEADTAPRGGTETVLLVEDDETFRELLRDLLADAGYRVLTAADGSAALSLGEAEGTGLDLLLSDLVMPGIKGSELAQRLTESHPSLRVVLMSGYSEVEEGAAAAEELGAMFLQKPFSTRELLRTVRRLLDSRGR